MSRRKANDRIQGQFFPLPHRLLNHPDYIALPHRAKSLLCDLMVQYNGNNNGDLCATESLMKKRGWNSNSQLELAIKDLREANLIKQTKQGGRDLGPSLFAFAWLPIHECGGKLEVMPTTVASMRL